jgi:hypothetical protein
MNNLVTIVTFFTFFIEAMLHYTIGMNSGKKKFIIRMPQTKDLIKIVTVLLFFSILNGIIISSCQKMFNFS